MGSRRMRNVDLEVERIFEVVDSLGERIGFWERISIVMNFFRLSGRMKSQVNVGERGESRLSS